ncbi:GNAT family N-acetyltransferase [Nocardioides agariphilus]
MAADLRLDPLTVADAEEMTVVLADSELYRVIGGSPPTEEELRGRYERQVVGRSADGREEWLNWIVRVDGVAVGFVQASVDDHSRAVVAWVIGTAWQGQGIATAAARQMLALLADRGVTTIDAYVAPGHLASELVAARAGLVATGEHDANGEQRWTRSLSTEPM